MLVKKFISKKNTITADPVKRKILKKRFVKTQCSYIYPEGHLKEGQRCTENAIDGLCRFHGGSKESEGVSHDSKISTPTLLNNQVMLKQSVFDPNVHPISFISLSMQGKSKEEIAMEFGVSASTINTWADKYTAFSAAFEVGNTAYKAFWIAKGVSNLENTRFNTALYKFLTGNLIGFSEKIEQKNLNLNVSGVMRVPETIQNASDWETVVQSTKRITSE